MLVNRRYKALMQQADTLDRAGLTQDAVSAYQHASIIYPRRPEPYIQLAMAKIKLRRLEEAQRAIDFARNHIRTKAQRFGVLLIEARIAYAQFEQHRTPGTAAACHHLINCLLDLKPTHPFPLHFRVVLHLDMATDPHCNPVRQTLELEFAATAMQRYLCLAGQFAPVMQKYHARFVPELAAYLQKLAPEDQAAWTPALDALRLHALAAEHTTTFHFAKRFTMNPFTKIFFPAALFCLSLLSNEAARCGIFIIDCADIC